MAISSFGRGGKGGETTGGTPVPMSTSSSSSSSGGGMGGLTAFIDQGSEFEGKLSFKDTVRIDGSFRGEISSENTLIVGESGEIEATIKSLTVVVSGSVTGDVIAGKQIILHKTARVQGDLKTPSVTIEEGAVFNGNLSMDASSAGAQSSGNLKSVHGGEGKGHSGGQPGSQQKGGSS